ncbi:DUF4870 domain-containing protein [Janibacter sp. G56]|uniref:DUF4870 domain-containing protein n=1 Tax=Janibacter sp. G56 TaxID=3418717 RepID=UPI003CFE855E
MTQNNDPQQGWQQMPPAPYANPAMAQPLSPEDERRIGMASHLSALVLMILSAGVLSFLAPLVIYLVYKDRGPFVRQHSANSLNVQITMAIGLLISIPLMFVLIGFLTFALMWVYAFVVHLLGAIKANNGEWYDPPMTLRLVR